MGAAPGMPTFPITVDPEVLKRDKTYRWDQTTEAKYHTCGPSEIETNAKIETSKKTAYHADESKDLKAPKQ